MFGWLRKSKESKEGRLYDLRNRIWGHNIEFDGDGKLPHSRRVHGWLTPYVSEGDMFLYPATKGLAVWLLMKVENCNDPRDMFFGTVGIIRYATEEDLKRANKVEDIEAKVGFRFV